MKKSIFKVLAMLLVLVMVLGSIPVSAKAKTVTVTTKAALAEALRDPEPATITFEYNGAGKVVIHSQDGKESNKKLIIEASKANINNWANVKSINVKACKSYTEKGSENVLYVKDKNAKIKIAKNVAVGKIVIQTNKISIDAKDGSSAVIVAKKSNGKATVKAANGSTLGLSIVKKINLKLRGVDTAFVALENKADGTKVTAYLPILAEFLQDGDLVMKKGSEGSIIDKANDAIDVEVANQSEEPVIVLVGGELPTTNPDDASTAAIKVEGVN